MNKVIKIENYKYGTHIIELYKNGERLNPKIQVAKNNVVLIIEDGLENDIYELKVINDCLRSTGRAILYGIILWVAALVGAIDTLNEITPVGFIVKFSCIGNVGFKCLKLGNSSAYQVYGECTVFINKFILEKNLYKRWIYTVIMPLEIVLLTLLIALCSVFKFSVISAIIIGIFIIMQIYIMKYINKISKWVTT